MVFLGCNKGEQELAGTQVQGKVFVSPAAHPELRLPATLDILYPGRNVTVALETKAPSAVILPKAAVVIRSVRTLVFTYDEASGRAK